MKCFPGIVFLLFVNLSAFSQREELSTFSYVVVPESFTFSKEVDQYKLNSMTVFYLEKSGFHAFSENNLPQADPCEGLYADVEKLGSILGGRLQVILRDCKGQEIYRSEIGRSKIKDFEKGFQDALRRAFKGLERLGVKQKEVVFLNESQNLAPTLEKTDIAQELSLKILPIPATAEKNLPTSKFSSFLKDGKSYLLRKTDEGYSFYEENTKSENGLRLMGKIIVMENVVRFMDTSGNLSEVDFDASGNLIITGPTGKTTYQLAN